MSVQVTENAIDRYIELIAPVSRPVAQAIIASAEAAVEAAARFGAHVVKTPTAKLLLQVDPPKGRAGEARMVKIVTVIPKNHIDHYGLTLAEREAEYRRHAEAHAA